MILNPIARREVLLSLRTTKAVMMQAAFFLVAAAIVYLHWPSDGLQDLAGQQSRQIFSILAIGELLMVVLLAPAFTAASLTTEKEHGTFESVYSTALRPWEIAVGKMAGALTFGLLMVLSGLAALALPLLMGGLGAVEVLKCTGILLLAAVHVGMLGLLVSSLMHRSYRAIIVTYAVLAVMVFLVALPCWPLSGFLIVRGSVGVQAVLHVLASLSPLQAMLSVVWPQSPYAAGASGLPPFWMLYLPSAAIMILATAAVCLAKLRRPITPPRPREKLLVIERDGKITSRSLLFLIDPRKRKRPIAWWQNPVLMKEFRTRPMLQGQWLVRAFATCLIVSVVLMFVVSISITALSAEGSGMMSSMMSTISALMVILVLLLGPAMAGGTICGDVETGVWDLMRTTRLSSWQIVSGKFQAAIIPMLLVVLAMVPALMILLYFDVNFWTSIVRVLAVVGMTAWLVAATGMFFSGLFLRTSTATAWTYGIIVGIGLLTLMVVLAPEGFSQRLVSWVYALNPVAAALDASGMGSLHKFDLVARHLQISLAATLAMTVATVVRVHGLRKAD